MTVFNNYSYNNMKAENAKVRTELDAKTKEVNKLTLKLIRYIYYTLIFFKSHCKQ